MRPGHSPNKTPKMYKQKTRLHLRKSRKQLPDANIRFTDPVDCLFTPACMLRSDQRFSMWMGVCCVRAVPCFVTRQATVYLFFHF